MEGVIKGRQEVDKLYLIIPAYNEAANIKQTIDDWYSVAKNHGAKLLIIDDGSKDNTYEIIRNMSESRALLEVTTKANSGHGATVLYGYKYAIDHGADWIFQTDADGQTNPAEFEEFWNLRESYDIVLGYRPVRGDGQSRAFVEKVVCFLLHLYFGVKVPDANAPFRLMKSSVLAKYITKLPLDYNLPNIMLTAYFARYKENLTFVPISFKPRQGGVNSINVKRIFQIGWKALGDFRQLKKGMD